HRQRLTLRHTRLHSYTARDVKWHITCIGQHTPSPTTYTHTLHDALPISRHRKRRSRKTRRHQRERIRHTQHTIHRHTRSEHRHRQHKSPRLNSRHAINTITGRRVKQKITSTGRHTRKHTTRIQTQARRQT